MTSRATPAYSSLISSEATPTSEFPVRLGISRCLLGEPVRYDGGHKRDAFLVERLGPHVEWIPVCPEVEAGFSTPREAMRLVDDVAEPRLMTVRSHADHTEQMRCYTRTRLRELQALNLAGYIFKKDSPSCGTRRVRVYTRDGHRLGTGKGLFADAFQRRFPLTPVEDEGRLRDPGLLENFLERVFGCHRWQSLMLNTRLTHGLLAAFHTVHTCLLLAHSRRHYQALGRLVADTAPAPARYPVRQTAQAYGQLFMEALAVKPTIRKHANVLRYVAGHFKGALRAGAQEELDEVIAGYRKGVVPLSVPLTLIRRYVQVLNVPALNNQVYLAPHPGERLWRNPV